MSVDKNIFLIPRASTRCSSGALIVDGGVGIGGNLNVCGIISASGGSFITGQLLLPIPLQVLDVHQEP